MEKPLSPCNKRLGDVIVLTQRKKQKKFRCIDHHMNCEYCHALLLNKYRVQPNAVRFMQEHTFAHKYSIIPSKTPCIAFLRLGV